MTIWALYIMPAEADIASGDHVGRPDSILFANRSWDVPDDSPPWYRKYIWYDIEQQLKKHADRGRTVWIEKGFRTDAFY